MAGLARVQQKVFGDTAASSQFGQIGSVQAGTPVTTKDLATIQSLSQYLAGLFAITDTSTQAPYTQDFNSLFFMITTQLKYLFEKGIPEWETNTTYYQYISIVQVNGVIYQFQNATPGSGVNPVGDSGTNWKSLVGGAVDGGNWATLIAGTDSRKHDREASNFPGDYRYSAVYRPTYAWDPANPTLYQPWIPLDDFSDYKDVTDAHFPDFGSVMRAKKLTLNEGTGSDVSDFTITAWSITSNVVTVTFGNTANNNAMIALMLEDKATHTIYKAIQVPTIGNVVAGVYQPLTVDGVGRTMTFNLTASNGSGSGSWNAQILPFYPPGTPTSTRLWSAQGLSLIAPNDANFYFVAAMARRGYFQGHAHTPALSAYTSSGGGGTTLFASGAGTLIGLAPNSGGPTTDGTDGTPRFAKETNSPVLSAHLSIFPGRAA